MRDFLVRLKNYLDIWTPSILQVTEESRLFVLMRNLNLIDKLKFRLLDPTAGKMRPFSKYYILIKMAQIESLTDPAVVANQELLNYLRDNKNVYLIYDISTEAITFSDYTSKVLLSFHEILRKHNINNKKVFLLCSNANAEKHYKEWTKQNGLRDYRINLLGYHFYLFEYLWETQRCEWIQDNHSTLINTALDTVKNGKKRDKHFICLNLRPRKHRTALVLHLLDKGHIDKGNVTYFGDEFAEHDSVDKEVDRLDFLQGLTSKDRLISQLDSLKKITPLMLDKDSTKMKKDLWDRKPGSVEFLFPEGDDFAANGVNSYFEIVTETWLTDHSNSYITEKTIRPIIRLQPFIHVGSPYLLKYLRSIGFKTFSPYIDESYDEINDPHARLEAIFKEIDRLCNMSIDEIHQLYCDLWPRLLHNYEHFKNKLPQIAETQIRSQALRKINSNFIFRHAHE